MKFKIYQIAREREIFSTSGGNNKHLQVATLIAQSQWKTDQTIRSEGFVSI